MAPRMFQALARSRTNRRLLSSGSTMMVTLTLLLLIALGSLLMTRTLADQNRINHRRRALWQAFNFAESGIAIVQQWAINPNEYTPDSNLFVAIDAPIEGQENGLINSSGKFSTTYANLYNALQASSTGITITESMLTGMDTGKFTTANNAYLGKVESIQLLPPGASEPVACDFKIIAIGRTVEGIRRQVQAHLVLNPMLAIKLPAALLSYENVAVNGNAKVHWGEAWAKGSMAMQSQSQYDYLNTDQRAIWRTEGLINDWGGGWDLSGTDADVLESMVYPNNMGVESPWRMSADQTNGHFYQSVPSNAFPDGGWPNFDYKTFKDLALQHGRYYSTDASGNVYRDGIETAANKIDFMTEFGHADPNSVPYDLVFIDTINGTPSHDAPPAADGSNLATINPGTCSGVGLKAIMYMGANFVGTGAGDPSTIQGTDPDGNTVSLAKIFLDGVLICAGTCDMGGNRGIYGCAVAMRGWTGSGTPDIYYDSQLKNGISLGNGNAGSPFKITMQKNLGIKQS